MLMFGKNVIVDNDYIDDKQNNQNNQNKKKLLFGSQIIVDNEEEFVIKNEKPNIYTNNYNNYNNKMYNKDKPKNNNYSKPSNPLFNIGKNMSCQSNAIILSEISDSEYNRRLDIFKKLRNIILPEQRTKEWFEMRNNKITASDTGTVLNENKHEPQYMFIHAKVFGKTFESNSFCYHGKKFENVVKLIYEFDNDCLVDEFGLLSHPQFSFLGASPDGICNGLKRDGVSKSNLVGRMIEIKVPKVRKIKYEGDVKGDISPDYYWCQMQQQLECCDLDECDFTQCTIEEYINRQEYLDDTNQEKHFYSKRYNKYKGLIIEFLPRNLTVNDYDENGNVNENIIFDKANFLYPPKLDMTIQELDQWVEQEKIKLDQNPNNMFYRVVYWKLLEVNYTLVPRDKEWFNKVFPTLQKIWNYVEFLRSNPSAANEWKEFINNQTTKYNNKILSKIDDLINIYSKNLNIDEFMNDSIVSTPTPSTKSKSIKNKNKTINKKEKTEDKPEEKPEEKPENKPEEKTEEKPEEKPEEKTEEKTEEKKKRRYTRKKIE